MEKSFHLFQIVCHREELGRLQVCRVFKIGRHDTALLHPLTDGLFQEMRRFVADCAAESIGVAIRPQGIPRLTDRNDIHANAALQGHLP